MQSNEELCYVLHLKGLTDFGSTRPAWDFMNLPVSDLEHLAKKDTRFNLPSKAEGPMSSEEARNRLFSLYVTFYYRDRDPIQHCPKTIDEVMTEIDGNQEGKVSALYIRLKPGTNINSDAKIIDCIENIGFCNIRNAEAEINDDPDYQAHVAKLKVLTEQYEAIPTEQSDARELLYTTKIEPLQNAGLSIRSKHNVKEFTGDEIRSALVAFDKDERIQEKYKELESLSRALNADENIDTKTKDRCTELMGMLQEYKHSLAGVQPKMPIDDASVNNIQTQATEIAAKVKEFSKDAAGSPNWGKILGLTLVTVGLGLIVIVPLLLFKKTALRHEHPIVVEARNLIQEGEILVNESLQNGPSAMI